MLTTYDNFKPQFGKILDILASDQTIIFHIDLYYTKHFDEHFMSFSIDYLSTSSYINLNNLVLPEPLLPHTFLSNRSQFVCLITLLCLY